MDNTDQCSWTGCPHCRCAELVGAAYHPDVHQRIFRHFASSTIRRFWVPLVASAAAFSEHAVHDVHHSRGNPDPSRPPTSLLGSGLHAGNGVVPLPTPRSGRPNLDREGRCGAGQEFRANSISIDLLWILNGAAFYVLLFTTNQGQRLIPITWDVFPNAISTAIQYASLNFPVDHTWTAITAFNSSAILSLSLLLRRCRSSPGCCRVWRSLIDWDCLEPC
jgi:hypothetical protein